MNRSNEVQRRLGVILSLVYTLVGIAAGFLFTPICTAKLGQSEYGVYTLAFSMVSYLGVFDLGFGSALIRYSARLRARSFSRSFIAPSPFDFFLIISPRSGGAQRQEKK